MESSKSRSVMELCKSRLIELLKMENISPSVNEDTIEFEYRGVPNTISVQTNERNGIIILKVNAPKTDTSCWQRETCEWSGSKFEPAIFEIISILKATQLLEVAKHRLVEVLKSQNVTAVIEGDTVRVTERKIVHTFDEYVDAILTPSPCFNFTFRSAFEDGGKHSGQINFNLNQTDFSEWFLGGDHELAILSMVDSWLRTNLLYVEVVKRNPSFPSEIEACKQLIVSLFQSRGVSAVLKDDIFYAGSLGSFIDISDGKERLSAVFILKACNLRNIGVECQILLTGSRMPFRWSLGNFQWISRRLVDDVIGTNLVGEFELEKYGLIPKEQAQKAAAWWATKMRGDGPKFPLQIDLETGGLMGILQMALQEQDNGDRIGRFEKLLADKLETKLAVPNGVGLTVDYDPCEILGDCWEASNPGSLYDGFGRFPCKTRMRIFKDKILIGSTLQEEKHDQPL